MPDLKELYAKFRGSPANMFQAGAKALTSPVETLTGMTVDPLRSIGQFAGRIAADTWQGVSGNTQLDLGPLGTHTPHQTVVPGNRDVTTGEVIPEWNQRVASLANAATMGIRPMFWDNYDKTNRVDSAAAETIRAMTPMPEMQAIMYGQSMKNPGQPLEPREYGEMLTMGALKLIPLVKGGRAVKNYVTKGTFKNTPFENAMSTVEKEAAKADGAATPAAVGADPAVLAELRGKIAQAKKDKLPDMELGLHKDLLAELDKNSVVTNVRPGFVSEVFHKLDKDSPGIWESVFKDALVKAEETGLPIKRITQQIADTVEFMPGITDSIKEIAIKHGMDPTQIAGLYPLVADAIRSSAKSSGQTLNDISRVAREANRYYDSLLKTNPELADAIAQMRGQAITGSNPVHPWTAFSRRFNAYSDVVRGALTSGIPTFDRNATVGAAGFASTLFDDIMTSSYQYAIGKGLAGFGKMERAPSFKEAFHRPIVDLITLQEQAMGGKRSLWDWYNNQQSGQVKGGLLNGLEPYIDEANQLYPTVIGKLLGSPVDDLVHVDLLSGGLKDAVSNLKKGVANVETVGDGARLGLSVLQTPNIAQEMFWRKLFFTAELRKNAPRLGFKTPEAMFEDLRAHETPRQRWFGEQHTPETYDALTASGELAKRAGKSIEQFRLDNALAAKGRKLHSTEIARIRKTAGPEQAALDAELQKVGQRLHSGESWSDIGPTLSSAAQRVFKGQILTTGNMVAEAAERALKNTFATTPTRGTFGYGLLKMYQDMPLLYALGTPFPRFLLNSTNWILEHDPSEALKVFNPKFAKQLAEIAVDPTKISDVRMMEQFGRAQTGVMLWAGAHAIRNSKYAGPKYYQLNAGKNEDGSDRLIDMRVYNPFVQFAFIDHMMQAAATGQDPNLTGAELLEALVGLRRLNEVGVFAITDIIRQVDSTSPGAFVNSLKPIAGQYMASALTPFRIPIDLAAAFGHEKSAEQKDLSGNELLGPSINNIPVLRDILPARPDPFTGKPGTSQYPVVRLLGPNVRDVTVLEQQLALTGVPLNDYLGNFSDPVADRMVREKIGNLMGRKLSDGRTLANVLGERIATATAGQPLELKKSILQTLFVELRKTASQAAMAENPMVFMEHIIRQQPELARPVLRDKLDPIKEQYFRDRNNPKP